MKNLFLLFSEPWLGFLFPFAPCEPAPPEPPIRTSLRCECQSGHRGGANELRSNCKIPAVSLQKNGTEFPFLGRTSMRIYRQSRCRLTALSGTVQLDVVDHVLPR